MRTIHSDLYILIIISSAILLMGCPISTSYPLGTSGEQKIDERLLGTWKNDSSGVEVKKVIVRRINSYEYMIRVVEKGPRYEVEGTKYKGWLTTIKDHQFLVLQAVKVSQPTYYAYHITFGDGTLTTQEISLLVEGKAAVTSTEAYRKEAEASMEKEGFLTNEIVWKRE